MRVLTAVNGAKDLDGGVHARVVAPSTGVPALAGTERRGKRVADSPPGQLVEECGPCHAPH